MVHPFSPQRAVFTLSQSGPNHSFSQFTEAHGPTACLGKATTVRLSPGLLRGLTLRKKKNIPL